MLSIVTRSDPREQPMLPPDPPPPAALIVPRESVEAAKAIQRVQRRAIIESTRREQGKLDVQFREQLRDMDTAVKLADVMLTAEADERAAVERPDFRALPSALRHRIQGDMLLAVRSRRTVYRRSAEWKHREAIAETARELLSHKLSEGEIEMFAAAASGKARAALNGVLTGAIAITPTQYAAATHGFLAEIE